MTDSAADIGYQSRFKLGNSGSPVVYTAIAEVVSFTPPSITFGEVQTTHLNTPGAMHTYRPTLADPGEVPCTINYIPGGTEDAAMRAMFDRSTRPFEIEYPNGARVRFNGFARNFEPGEVELEGLLQASFTIRVSGAPTYFAAPAPVAPSNSVVPTITGTAAVGSPLTAGLGTWAGAPTPWFLYQWKAAGTAIPGATGSIYVPVPGDVGKAITVTVTGYNQLGSVDATSTATASVTA